MSKSIKKKISAFLAFVLVLTCFTGLTLVSAQDGIEINSVNFPDDNFRSFVTLNYDTEPDSVGVLTPSEISSVKNMPVFSFSTDGIKTLKGIEYFTELESVYAGALGLEEADLSALTKLKSLTINGNNLTSLDVSANTALETLNCRGNLSLESIVLPPSIKDLQCDQCALTSLDVSMCTGLVSLRCYDNQISYLDLSQNTALTTLMCSRNRLSSLDLSANTQLTHVTNQYIGEQIIDVTATAAGKTVSVPVKGLNAQNIVASTLSDGGYNPESGSFEFSDYNAAQNGFDYSYNVNLAGAEDMSVHVNVSKNFYKVSYYESQGGNLIDFSYVALGGSAEAPDFPTAPDGYTCPSWSLDGQNITQDTDIYVVWNENHNYSVVGYSDLTATIRCSVCGDEYEKSLYDCFNASLGEADYDPLMDYNHDGYINSRDHSLMYRTFN